MMRVDLPTVLKVAKVFLFQSSGGIIFKIMLIKMEDLDMNLLIKMVIEFIS